MSDALFYVDALPEVGGLAVVDGDEGFHAATVRRLRVGERIVLGDGAGELADCEVAETGKRELTATVLARRTANRPQPAVTVVQAIPKAERSELAIELATEAGADAFVAWQAARCVARWDGPEGRQGSAPLACGGAVGGPAVAARLHPRGRRRDHHAGVARRSRRARWCWPCTNRRPRR